MGCRKEVFWADLALVWCLKPRLLVAAAASAAAQAPGLRDEPVAAEEAGAVTAAAPESGCCSGAVN